MTKPFIAGTLAALFCVLLPMLAAENRVQKAQDPRPGQPIQTQPPTIPEAPTEQIAQSFDGTFLLPVLVEGRTVSMELREYLTGALLAELPSSFSMEAMKAQATACRTYALKRYQSRKHGSAAVCTDASCCEGWLDPQLCEPAAAEKAREAVRLTDGMVIEYDGELIDATFFSCSGGRTEDAVAVWGSDFPYLQAVDSPGEENAKHYEDELSIPLDEFVAVLQEALPEADFSGGNWIGSIRHTNGGGVAEIELGGQTFTGKQLRRLFHLNATAFTLELTDGAAVFRTHGFGHRVGMSQYGAEAMAQAGCDYIEILKHYYQDVTVRKMA